MAKGHCYKCDVEVPIASDGGCPYCAHTVGAPLSDVEKAAIDKEIAAERTPSRVGSQNLTVGLAIFGVGVLVTALSGGHLVAWGAVLFGAIQAMAGVRQLATRNKR